MAAEKELIKRQLAASTGYNPKPPPPFKEDGLAAEKELIKRQMGASRARSRATDDSAAKQKELIRRQMAAARQQPAADLHMGGENETTQPLPGDGMTDQDVRDANHKAAARYVPRQEPKPTSSETTTNADTKLAPARGPAGNSGALPGAFASSQRAPGPVPEWIRRQALERSRDGDQSVNEPADPDDSMSSLPPELRVDPEYLRSLDLEGEETDALGGPEQPEEAPTQDSNADYTADCHPSREPHESIEAKTNPKLRFYIAGAVLLVIIIIVAVALGVTLSSSGGGSETNNIDEPQPEVEVNTANCMVTELYQQCENGTQVPLECSTDRFNELRAWVANVDSYFVEEDDSCAPTNLALYALAHATFEAEMEPQSRLNRYALGVFYLATNGPRWRADNKWLGAQSVCEWRGIGCLEDGNVVTMELESNRLSGSLPPQLALLSALGTFSVFFFFRQERCR